MPVETEVLVLKETKTRPCPFGNVFGVVDDGILERMRTTIAFATILETNGHRSSVPEW